MQMVCTRLPVLALIYLRALKLLSVSVELICNKMTCKNDKVNMSSTTEIQILSKAHYDVDIFSSVRACPLTGIKFAKLPHSTLLSI